MKEKAILFCWILLFSTVSGIAQPNCSWAYRFGGANGELASCVRLDAAGNSYLTGWFKGTNLDFDPGVGIAMLYPCGVGLDSYVAKYDAAGNYVWARSFGCSSFYSTYSVSCQPDNQGNVYVTGYFIDACNFDQGNSNFTLTASGNFDIFISKYDPNGNFLWAKQIAGSNSKYSQELNLDNNGNIYLCGYFNGAVDFDPGIGVANLTTSGGYSDIFLAKYDPSGNYLWAKNFGYPASDDLGFAVRTDGIGNVYMAGRFTGPVDFDPGIGTDTLFSSGFNSFPDIVVAKYDPNGNHIWAKQLGGSGQDIPSSLYVDQSGNAFLTGLFVGPADFDPGSGTYFLNSVGAQDIFIAKLNASGNFVYAKAMGGTSSDVGDVLDVNAGGEVYLAGAYFGTADFDPSSGIANLNSGNADHMFLAKYDAGGNYVWAYDVGGPNASSDRTRSLRLNTFGDLYLAGFIYNTTDFDLGLGVTNLTSAGFQDIFFVKYGLGLSSEHELARSQTITSYPDPVTTFLNVDLSNVVGSRSIIVYDIYGRKINELISSNDPVIRIDVRNYECGLYILQVESNGQLISSSKFLKE